MLRVLSDILLAADGTKVTLPGLLDLSASFACIDHAKFLQRKRLRFGLTDDVIDVINWICLFLTGRSQSVNGIKSSTQSVFLGVHQGSILRSILYVLNGLWSITELHCTTTLTNTDDYQIYVRVLYSPSRKTIGVQHGRQLVDECLHTSSKSGQNTDHVD